MLGMQAFNESVARALRLTRLPDPSAQEMKRNMQAVSKIARGGKSRFGTIEEG
jgi:hypothetical protein